MVTYELRTMRGPNMWSEIHKLIVLKLNFPVLTNGKINKLQSWQQLNGLAIEQGVDPKLFLTEIIAELAKKLQPDANELFATAKIIGKGSYYAIIEYKEERSGTLAAKSAVKIAESILKKGTYNALEKVIESVAALYTQQFPGPSTSAILEAAKTRGIPFRESPGGYFVFGQGKFQKKIGATISGNTGDIAVSIAGDKEITKQILSDAYIPVPKGFVISKKSSVKEILSEIEFPVVVKPLNSNHGKGISIGITTESELLCAFSLAKKHSHYVIVEKQIHGNDYRFLVIGNKFVAAAQRTPACVTGDGISTIQELIDQVNLDPLRGDGHRNVLTKITINENTLQILKGKDLTLSSVPEKGKTIHLKDTANLSTGGTAVDVTDEVHPDNVLLAERAAALIGLDICGIDIMAPSVSSPICENGGAVLEVNAAPGLRMHVSPSGGKMRNVGTSIIELLYPEQAPSRIPIIAVTGTNGKTTTSRLIAHIARQQGHTVGLTTTEGIYLNNTLIHAGDCSGPASAKLILQEPSVEYAVLECARGGIIRNGLAFDQCDIAIVTNIASDHLGLKDINSLEDLAHVKAVVPRAVKKYGYAILNADDDLVYAMMDTLKCKIALFSTNENNPRIQEHISWGGYAAVMDHNKELFILKGDKKTPAGNACSMPLTMNGNAEFMIENILPSVLASHLLNFNFELVKTSLLTFKPSAEQTPGRLNHFDVNGSTVIIDYAHNPHGMKALSGYLKKLKGSVTGIIAGVGDRRGEDLVELGKAAAEMYDEIIIRSDKDLRGRTEPEISAFIIKGLTEINPHISYKVIPEMEDALRWALSHSFPGNYIVMNAEDVHGAIKLVKEFSIAKVVKEQHQVVSSAPNPFIEPSAGLQANA